MSEKSMRTIKIAAFGVFVLVAAVIVVNSSLNIILAPDAPEPYVVQVDETHVIRYSFVGHHSFVRTATTWYDRSVEEYTLQDGKLVLTSHIIYEYHYPILGGSGHSVYERVLK